MNKFSKHGLCVAFALVFLALPRLVAQELMLGVGKADITPDFNVRLSGYASRRAESEGVALKLWAKALAIGEGANAVVILTVDNLGLPGRMTEELAAQLKTSHGIKRENVSICSSHTHTAPCLTDVAPEHFCDGHLPGESKKHR